MTSFIEARFSRGDLDRSRRDSQITACSTRQVTGKSGASVPDSQQESRVPLTEAEKQNLVKSRITSALGETVLSCHERRITLSKFEKAKDTAQDIWKTDATTQWRIADESMNAARADLQYLWSQAAKYEASHPKRVAEISKVLSLVNRDWTVGEVDMVVTEALSHAANDAQSTKV